MAIELDPYLGAIFWIITINFSLKIGTVIVKTTLSMNHIYKNNQCVLPYLGYKKYECFYGDICSSEDIKHALKGVSHVIM